MPPFRRRLPPTVPPTPTAVHETVVGQTAYEPVDPVWLARLDDRLRSLQTAVVLLGIVAVAGLGVAIYALIHDRPGNRNGASASRVSALQRRVDDLSNRPTTSSAVRSDVNQLQDQVKTLTDAANKANSTANTNVQQINSSLTKLNDRVNTLEQQVSQLSSVQGTTTAPTTTTP